MIWTLYRRSAWALVKATTASLSNLAAEHSQQRLVIRQLGRIISCLKQAHSQHPAWLAQQYGTVDGYLEKHLSADDWRFVVELRRANTACQQQIQPRQPSLSGQAATMLSN